MKDYANIDGKKIKRIMDGGVNEFFMFPKGVISKGQQLPALPKIIKVEV